MNKLFLLCCLLVIVGVGCSSSNPVNPATNNTDQTVLNDGPGGPENPGGVVVKIEPRPTFIGVAYIGYPTKFRAIAWNKDGEIIGFCGDEFDPLDSESFTWKGTDKNGILLPDTVGNSIVSVTYKGVQSEAIIVKMIEPQIVRIDLDPYWTFTMDTNSIAPFMVRIIDVRGGLISTDPTRVTWIGGPDENGMFRPLDVGTYHVYARLDNITSIETVVEVINK